MRAVLDANVIVSAALSAAGPPAELIRRWQRGQFELTVSERLLVELEAVFAYPKLRRRVDRDDAAAVVAALRAGATVVADQETAPRRAADPADDYLLALAESQRAVIVSGDRHLLDLAGRFPVLSPREFLDLLG